MAVNTKNRRASAMGMLWMPVAPVPSGAGAADIDAGDRKQVLGIYRGIASIAVAAIAYKPLKGMMLGIYP